MSSLQFVTRVEKTRPVCEENKFLAPKTTACN
jgi:hypothetical protein